MTIQTPEWTKYIWILFGFVFIIDWMLGGVADDGICKRCFLKKHSKHSGFLDDNFITERKTIVVMKLYIDTNVIIDAIKKRKNKFGEDLSRPAMKILTDTIACKHHIICSEWMFEELDRHLHPEDVRMLLQFVKRKVIGISYSHADTKLAKLISPQNPDDALHIILAERTHADIIVTSDTKHFQKIRTDIPIKKPKWI